ncbi:MAG: bifunctional transaldolase/phosoglucose isomerase [Chloroflexi bacterium]|nr:bifunctional transaldolase/phosoglucose isomerase [Chloroflexota bacterium]
MTGNPPVDVQNFGQSIWYDNISRQLIQNGEIKRMVNEDGVLGMTSNPTIFEKAIANSTLYDTAIAQMLDSDANTIFEALAKDDIRAVADILRPIFDRTNGEDGYISLEVSPLIANDTATTVREAFRLFEMVDRPNVMIKIPATDAGLPAIEEVIAGGVNVNVTLIFSVEYYKRVTEAYIRGLEQRLAKGQDVKNIASVASFFLSRIDSMVDQQLDSNIRSAQGRSLERVAANRKLLGTAAISNAKLAYREFKHIFEGARFKKLREAGAQVQRPLWASTSTKNPAYPDTMYVDTLIGAHTVNTVPPETLVAFKDHGTAANTLEQDIDKAAEIMDMLAEVGIEMEMVTNNLLLDGVEKFAASYNGLMEAIEGKRKMLKAGIIKRQSGVVGQYEPDVREAMDHLKDAPKQIWERNAAWWKPEPAHVEVINNRLGWLAIAIDGRIDRSRLYDLKAKAHNNWKHVVLLGMGGSSLAPEVLRKSFGHQAGYPDLLVLDSTVPATVQRIESQIDPKQTVFIVASKSGTTIETSVMFDYFYDKLVKLVGADKAGQHFISITDPGSELVTLSQQRKVYAVFENPADIGGRYSALSYFGLVPAALLGLNLDTFFARAERMTDAIDKSVAYKYNPALWLGAVLGTIAQEGRDKITIIASPQIESFGDWAEQLIAESTGKEGVGFLPVVGATVGHPHDYDDDRVIVYMRLDDDPSLDGQVQQLREAGHPVYLLELQDAYDLAGEFLRWEFATAVMGQMLKINPFDEPDVTSAKKATKALLDIYQKEGRFPVEKPVISESSVALYADTRTGEMLNRICTQRQYDVSNLAGMLAAFISLARSGNYFALLVYMDASDDNEATLETIRRRLRHTTRRAVTLGYGPRYLHSTGQLHKGGANNGVFILITVDDNAELPIPGQPLSFSILKQAQGLGDLETLRQRHRRVVRLHISGDVKSGLQKIMEAIEATEAKLI